MGYKSNEPDLWLDRWSTYGLIAGVLLIMVIAPGVWHYSHTVKGPNIIIWIGVALIVLKAVILLAEGLLGRLTSKRGAG